MEKRNKTVKRKIDWTIPSFVVGMFGFFGLMGYSMQSCNNKSEKEWEERFKKSNVQIETTVLDKFYENRLEPVPEKYIDGLLSQAYSNETVKLESKCILKCRTDNGKEIAISVINGPNTPKESLDILVNKGSRISFPKGNIHPSSKYAHNYERLEKETYFTDSTQFGSKRADRIKILK